MENKATESTFKAKQEQRDSKSATKVKNQQSKKALSLFLGSLDGSTESYIPGYN